MCQKNEGATSLHGSNSGTLLLKHVCHVQFIWVPLYKAWFIPREESSWTYNGHVYINVVYVVLLFSFTFVKHRFIAILIWCIYLLRIHLIILLWDMLFINLHPHMPEMRIPFVFFLFEITTSRVEKTNFDILFYFLGAISFCPWMYLGGFIVCKVHR